MTAIDDLLTDWAAAECNGDVSTLDRLLTDDFAGIGPLGFQLAKPAWLARFQGGLSYDRFELEEIQPRHYENAAVVTARQIGKGTLAGDPLPFETLRATLTLIGRDDRWRLAAVHMSFVAGTPGAPPLPAVGRPAAGQTHRSRPATTPSDARADHG
jgi:ketosteroid isomerase-like protein